MMFSSLRCMLAHIEAFFMRLNIAKYGDCSYKLHHTFNNPKRLLCAVCPRHLTLTIAKKQMSSWRHSPINSLANVLTLLRNLSSDLFPPNRMSYDFHFPSRKNNVHQKLKTASSRWFIDSEWINTMLKSKRVARSSSIYGESGSAMCERQTWNKARKKTRKRKSIQPDVSP